MRSAFTMILLWTCLGCSTESEPVLSPVNGGLVVQSVPQNGGVVAAGYEFTFDGKVNVSMTAVAHTYRSDEASLVQYVSGGAIAWSLPHASQMRVGWPADPAVHEAMVRAFLIRQGIPAAELGSSYRFRGTLQSAPIAAPAQVATEELGFSTSFHRVIAGVEVPDSHAGAQLNAAGVPVALSISWPKIPPALVSQATTMLQRTEGWTLPAAAGRGMVVGRSRVVIRHSPPGVPQLTFAVGLRTDLAGRRRSHIDTDELGNRVTAFDPIPTHSSTK